MNLIQLYDELPTTEGMSAEQIELLSRIMNLKSPTDFNFATDAEMDALEDSLDRSERQVPQSIRFKQLVSEISSKISESESDFV